MKIWNGVRVGRRVGDRVLWRVQDRVLWWVQDRVWLRLRVRYRVLGPVFDEINR